MANASGQILAAAMNANLAAQTRDQNAGILNTQAGNSLDALGTGATAGRDALSTGLTQSIGALGSGYGDARNDINAGVDAGTSAIAAGRAGFDPYAASGVAANSMYDNALGLNGAAGNTAATAAFQASPGYQWSVDQATDAAARKANALGIGGSGNTLAAITTLGNNLANTEYSSWLDRLNASKTAGMSAAGSQLGADTTTAGLQSGRGSALAGLDTGLGGAESSLYSGNASNLAGLETTLGQNKASVYTGLGNSLTNNNNNALQTVTNQFSNAGQAQDASVTANQNLLLGSVGIGANLLGQLGGAYLKKAA